MKTIAATTANNDVAIESNSQPERLDLEWRVMSKSIASRSPTSCRPTPTRLERWILSTSESHRLVVGDMTRKSPNTGYMNAMMAFFDD